MGNPVYGDWQVGRGVKYGILTTAQRTTIGSTLGAADEGLHVYDGDTDAYYFWDGAAWQSPSSLFSTFTIGDGTNTETIDLTGPDAMTFIGGEGLDSLVSATDNVTYSLDFDSLTEETGANLDYTTDYVAVYDASATAHRKVLLDELVRVNDQANGLDITLNASGELEVYYDFSELTQLATANIDVAADQLIIYDDSASTHLYINPEQLLGASVNTFNATTDWTAGTNVYTFTVTAATHGKGTNPSSIKIEESDGGTGWDEVLVHNVNVNASGDVELTVLDVPDLRFQGRVLINW